MSPSLPSEYLIAAIAVGGAVITFFIGLWAGVIVTSRHRHIAAALRERVERAETRLREADTKLETLRASYDSQSETCRVLEEEFANIGRERDALLRQVKETGGWDREKERARWLKDLQTAQAACEAKETESTALQQALAGAQNRYERAREEQQRLLDLVDRLQEQLHRLSGVERTAVRRQKKLARLRRQQLRARRGRGLEPAVAPAEEGERKAWRRSRRNRRQRAPERPSPAAPGAEAGPRPSKNRHW